MKEQSTHRPKYECLNPGEVAKDSLAVYGGGSTEEQQPTHEPKF